MSFRRVLILSLAIFAMTDSERVQAQAPEAVFRRANEHAARGRPEAALADYGGLAAQGVVSPALYWNWSQTAAAAGRPGEALWAMLCFRDLSPTDPIALREIDRLRLELGLDPSEMSLGFLGDADIAARRFHLSLCAMAAFLGSAALAWVKRARRAWTGGLFLVGTLLLLPALAGVSREPRGVVVRKEAPLLDIPRGDAVSLATLREGEVVPLLAEEGDYVKIQDASGARGYAHKTDVRRIARSTS